MPLNKTSLPYNSLKNQDCCEVISMKEFLRSKQVEELSKSMDYSPYKETQDLGSKVAALSPTALEILILLSSNPDGLTTKQISEHIGISRSPTRKYAERLVEDELGEREAIPHRYSEMPPTYKYRLSASINKEELLQVTQSLPTPKKRTAKKSSQTSKSQKPKNTISSEDIPTVFQSVLQDVKPIYRGGYWDAFVCVAQNGPAATRDVREWNEWANSVAHSRLTKLVEVHLLGRKEQSNQFIYFLTKAGVELSIQCGLIKEKPGYADYEQPSLPVAALSQDLDERQDLDESEDVVSSYSEEFLRTMSKNTLDDLASAVKFLASELAKLNQRISKIERSQQTLLSDFSLEDIERIVRESDRDSDN